MEMDQQQRQQELWQVRDNAKLQAEQNQERGQRRKWPIEQTIFQREHETYLRVEKDREREKQGQELNQNLHDAEKRAEQERERLRNQRYTRSRAEHRCDFGVTAEELQRRLQ